MSILIANIIFKVGDAAEQRAVVVMDQKNRKEASKSVGFYR